MDDEPKGLAAMTRAIGDLQAQMFVQHFILQEILWALAPAMAQPERFLTDMFESISRRMEQDEQLEGKEHAVDAEMRDYLERFFTLAGNYLRET
jgi:hypothetical protein